MRRNPYLFTPEEFNFLHQIFLKDNDETKLFTRIKKKKGVGLDKSEIQLIKRRYSKWKDSQSNKMVLLL